MQSFISQKLLNWEQDIIMLKTLNQFYVSLTAEVFIWDLNDFLKTDEKQLPLQKLQSQLEQKFHCFPTQQKSPELDLFTSPWW